MKIISEFKLFFLYDKQLKTFIVTIGWFVTHSIMYKFNNDQEKVFILLKELIIFDLKKNNIEINFDKNYFIKFANKEIEWKNKEEEEKVTSTLNFYFFIFNPNTSNPFLDIINYIVTERSWIFCNSSLNNFFETFDNKKLGFVFYAVIVIKSLTNPSYFRKSFYEDDTEEIISAENWHNSTNVLEYQMILIKNFIIFFDINIQINENLCLRSLFKFINLFLKNDIIKEKIILKKEGLRSIKTLKYWSIQKDSNLIDLISETNFSKKPYQLVSKNNILYEKGSHFSKIIPLCRKNWYSGEVFKMNDKNYIEKILNLKLYVDKFHLKSIRDLILKENKILKEEVRDDINKKTLELRTIFNKNTLNETDRICIKNLQKKINKLIDIERMNKMIEEIKEGEEKYLPVFFDFRGRNYFDDYLSPTFSRYTRLSFYYGIYNQEELDNIDISLINDFINEKIEYIIDKVLFKYNLKKKNYTVNCVFWILIGIGKHFINKEKIKIPLEDFLEKGLYYLENKNEFNGKKNLKDLIEINHYENILKDLKTEKYIKKSIILKDCTASVLQNLIKILGPKDQNSINLSNLGDPYNWYDPYSYILDKFKSSFDTEAKELIYFKRSTVKKTIMTNPYSAGEKTSWEYFKKSVKEEFNEISTEEEFNLKILFSKFYDFLNDFFEELNFFRNSSKKIIDYYINLAKKEKKIILISEDSKTDFIYYNLKTHYIDIKDKNEKRITKKIKKIDYESINYRKIYTSIRANVAHWLDAMFLRKVVNKLKEPIFTIHDEFAIDILNVNNLILISNEIANEEIKIDLPWDKSHNFKIFSLFILV